MNILSTFVLSSILLLSVFSTSASFAVPASNAIPDNYIVVLNDGISHPSFVAHDMAKKHGLSITHIYGTAIKGYSAVIPPAQLDKVVSDPRVDYVEQDVVISLDAKPSDAKNPSSEKKPSNPGKGGGDTTPAPTQTIPNGISLINGPGVVADHIDVAVIDTGIDSDHPDLNVVGGVSYVFKGKPSYDDGNGHGTHVAGTIGALDNEIGVVGVAPGVKLWSVRVLDNSGSGTLSGVIAGVDWVAANSDVIDVTNMSLGASLNESTQALNDAVTTAVGTGVVFVVAAGNESTNAATKSPASTPEAITVSALDDRDGILDSSDKLASFSNYGAIVDLIAPGVYIESTWKGGGYDTISGTSMASPHVAGTAAVYLSNNNASPQEVRDYLVSTGITWSGIGDPDGINEPLVHLP